ncbi:MAG: 3'-5' exonuclease [Lachnospiraceae bacterium]|nr:3'-5' exonuclease [Lachnospiraceae bacterium]
MIWDFTALDIETTGLEAKRDRIIEVGAVRVRNREITHCFNQVVNPGRKLEERIVQLTGITDEELSKAPYIEEVLPELLDFIGEDVLIGHRIMFDYSFVKRAACNQGLTFEKRGIDTLKIARKFLPWLESKRLTDLCQYYGILYDAHRAGNDARAAAQLYLKLAENFPIEEDFEPKELIYRVKKESPATQKQKERLYRMIKQHKLIINQDIDKLTRNEADRMADKIISRYGRM